MSVESKIMADRLKGYRILILETREEAQFSRLLTEQGAEVLQCPMFIIQDAPDPAPIEAWLERFIEKPFDDLVLMTGEGLRRLMKVVRLIEVEARIHSRARQDPEIRARSQTRPSAARDRAGAAERRRRSRPLKGSPRCCRHRSPRTSRRLAALSGQGPQRADRRDHRTGRRGR